jgi:hypothetical protein
MMPVFAGGGLPVGSELLESAGVPFVPEPPISELWPLAPPLAAGDMPGDPPEAVVMAPGGNDAVDSPALHAERVSSTLPARQTHRKLLPSLHEGRA